MKSGTSLHQAAAIREVPKEPTDPINAVEPHQRRTGSGVQLNRHSPSLGPSSAGSPASSRALRRAAVSLRHTQVMASP